MFNFVQPCKSFVAEYLLHVTLQFVRHQGSRWPVPDDCLEWVSLIRFLAMILAKMSKPSCSSSGAVGGCLECFGLDFGAICLVQQGTLGRRSGVIILKLFPCLDIVALPCSSPFLYAVFSTRARAHERTGLLFCIPSVKRGLDGHPLMNF